MLISVDNATIDATGETFRRRLRERREAAGLSQAQLALICDVAQSYISQMETGASGPPTIDRATMLAMACSTSIDYFAGLTDDPVPARGRQWPEGGAELLRLFVQIPPGRRSELIAVARIYAEAEARRRRAEMEVEFERLFDQLRQIGNPAQVERVIAAAAAALERDDFDEARAILRRALSHPINGLQHAGDGPHAHEG